MDQNKYHEALQNFRDEFSHKIADLHFLLKQYNKDKCNGIYDKSKSSFDLEQLIFQNCNIETFLDYSDEDNESDYSIESYN